MRIAVLLTALLPSIAGAQVGNCEAESTQCRLLVPTVSFGRIIAAGVTPETVATFTVTVTCSRPGGQSQNPLPPASIEMKISALPAVAVRVAEGQGRRADYGLYLDAALTRPWGDGSVNTAAIEDSFVLQGTQTTITRSYLLYGRINREQLLQAGIYSDAVAVTLLYTQDCVTAGLLPAPTQP